MIEQKIGNEDTHSPEMYEIIRRNPDNLTNWGVILLVIVSILSLCWFIKFPDVITTKVVITAPPSIPIISRVTGTIHLLMCENDKVEKGDLIGYLQSITSLNAIQSIEKNLTPGSNLSLTAASDSLGDLQRSFCELMSSLVSLNSLSTNDTCCILINKLQNQIETYQKLRKALSLNQKFTDKESKLQNQKLELAINQANVNLLSQTRKYKEAYTFVAPSAGTLSYLGMVENEQFVKSNKSLFLIIPAQDQLIATAELSIRDSNWVEDGLLANIRFENYDQEKYRLLQGEISSISFLPSKEKYLVTINLTGQIPSHFRKTLTFEHLTGTADIVTKEIRLVERFFDMFKESIKKHLKAAA